MSSLFFRHNIQTYFLAYRPVIYSEKKSGD